MAETSKLEWVDSTWNPWIGCTRVSPACDNCYAEAMAKHRGWAAWGAGEARHRTSAANWRKPLQWQNKAGDFFAAHGRLRRVFCASLADVFDSEVAEAWRADLWEVVRRCPDLHWLLLTKRTKLVPELLPADLQARPNVWVGTTVENRNMCALRLPLLRKAKAGGRFLSVEPLLEPVPVTAADLAGIDWVILGGESGPRRRELRAAWVRPWRDACQEAGIPFHFKQWSGLRPRALGRELDGRTWDEMAEIQPEGARR